MWMWKCVRNFHDWGRKRECRCECLPLVAVGKVFEFVYVENRPWLPRLWGDKHECEWERLPLVAAYLGISRGLDVEKVPALNGTYWQF